MEQRPRQRQPATHPLGEFAHALVAVLCQAHAIEEGTRFLGLTAVEPREEAEVLVGGELQVVVRRLECDADPPVVVSVPRSEISAQHGDGAFITVEQPDEDVLGRTFSGSAWTEEAEDLATFHRKGDVANGGPVSAGIGKAEGLGLNHRTG